MDEIRVWRVELRPAADALMQARAALSDDERVRAERLRETPGQRFILTRAALRRILGQRLNLAPGEVRLTRGPQGKPALDPRQNAAALEFSVSHSSALALVAIARGIPVGVDVERIRDDIDVERIVERFFAASERAEFAMLPPDRRRQAFFDGWTRKEAYVKARGLGLALPLSRFSVSLAPAARPFLVDPPADEPGPPRWSLVGLDVGPGYAAALATLGPTATAHLADWTGP